MPAGQPKAPILLYLRGARCNVTGSAPRMHRMQELVFMLVEGGSHHNTNHVGQTLAQRFSLK